jgi:signal transduction histidine kinase
MSFILNPASADACLPMIYKPPNPTPYSNQSNQPWPEAHSWAVDQMPLPAYLCDASGALLKCNAQAVELWGGAPDPDLLGLWHGWEKLFDADSHPLDNNDSPAAQSIRRSATMSTDVVVQARGEEPMRATVFSRPVMGEDGAAVGAVCAVSISGPADPSQAEERAAFLSILSHELRNPLSPIMSAAIALRRATSDPALSKMADIVDRQAKQLARFVDDLLDASRFHRARDVPCELRETSLGAVLDAALDPLGPALLSRRQSLSINELDRGAALRCDPARVAQALGNVLRNASAHSPDGAEIELRIYTDADKLLFVVDDHGSGIEADFAERAAEPFVQGPPADGRAPSGAGLGLAIARSVCIAHRGAMTLATGADGHGVHVELMLPIVARAA